MKKNFTSTAALALAAGIIGFTALPATTFAQQAPSAPGAETQVAPDQNRHEFRQHRGQQRFANREGMRQQGRDVGPHRGGHRGGGLLGFVCSERGAERLEIALVRMSHRLDLTAEQQPLFDELRDTALAAQMGFADTCATLRPERPQSGAEVTAETPDLGERFANRVEIARAEVAALEAVQPVLDALLDTLTDEQKASLQPRRGQRGEPGNRNRRGTMKQGAAQPATESPAAMMLPEGTVFAFGDDLAA